MEKKPTQKQIDTAKKLCNELKKINDKIIKAGFHGVYLDNDTANIMIGPSHDGTINCNAQPENVVASVRLAGWDGGGW